MGGFTSRVFSVGLRHDHVGASCLGKSVVSVFALEILFTVKI